MKNRVSTGYETQDMKLKEGEVTPLTPLNLRGESFNPPLNVRGAGGVIRLCQEIGLQFDISL
jgi:hypothetical protein